MSKIEYLRKALIKGRRVSGKQAMTWWGYYRLSDGIFTLRNRGYNIKTLMIERNGERFAEYYLVKGEE